MYSKVKQEINSSRDLARERAEKETAGDPNAWFIYKFPDAAKALASHEFFFGSLLHGQSIQELLNTKPEGNILDIAGPGEYIRTLGYSEAAAISLGDGRNEEQKEFDEKNHLHIMTGDIVTRHPWRALKDYMKEKGIKGFDLITCRPLAGFYITIPTNETVIFSLFGRAWDLLSTNGTLLSEVPQGIDIQTLVDIINEERMGEAEFAEDANTGAITLRITKTKDISAREIKSWINGYYQN